MTVKDQQDEIIHRITASPDPEVYLTYTEPVTGHTFAIFCYPDQTKSIFVSSCLGETLFAQHIVEESDMALYCSPTTGNVTCIQLFDNPTAVYPQKALKAQEQNFPLYAMLSNFLVA